MNILAYARSSRSAGWMAWASLEDDEVGEDDFQTQHTPVHCMVRRDGGGCGEPAMERMEAFGGEYCLAVICPGGHQQRGAQDLRGD